MPSVYQTTVKLLSDLIPTRALEVTLQEAAKQSGKTADQLGVRDVEKILKSTVYRQLQLSVPAALAKSRIQQTINALADLETGGTGTDLKSTANKTQVPDDALVKQEQQIAGFDETVRKFSLYFDWPETQKFRSLLGVIRDEHAAGRSIPNLIRDAGVLKDSLDRKLAELLVNQARDLSELKADYDRVKTIGGPKVRRLDTLIGQVSLEQERSTLAPAEIDRARKLASELRKLVESSVMSSPSPTAQHIETGPPRSPDGTPSTEFIFDIETEVELEIDFGVLSSELSPEQGEKLLEIDLGEEGRSLDVLAREFSDAFANSQDLKTRFDDLRKRHDQRELVTQELEQLRRDIKTTLEGMQKEQRQSLEALLGRINAVKDSGVDISSALLTAQIADGTLLGGVLISSELKNLSETVATLERQGEAAQKSKVENQARLERLLVRQRDALEEYALLGSSVESPELSRLRQDLQTATSNGAGAEETLRAFLEEQSKAVAAQTEKGTRAQLRSLKNRLDALPELPELAHQIDPVVASLTEALKEAEAGKEPSGLHDLMIKATLVLSDASRGVYARLEQLEEQAREIENRSLVERIAALKGTVPYPDLAALSNEVLSARQSHQLDQQRELREIENSAAQYQVLEGYRELLAQVESARLHLQEGMVLDLSEIWANLEHLSSQADDERASLDARAEHIAEEYHRMRGLEGDTVQMLGRLSKQVTDRKALGQMSVEAMKAYVEVIERAEALLGEAQAEYEAGQAVLENLSSGNALEGLLDIFNAFTFGDEPAANATTAKKEEVAPTIIDKVEGALKDYLQGLVDDPGISAVALIQEGDLKFGRFSARGTELVGDLVKFFGEISEEMGRQLPRMITLEHSNGAAIVMLFPDSRVQVLLNAVTVTQSTRLLGLMQQKGYAELGKLF
jgi:chromosome segregation protein